MSWYALRETFKRWFTLEEEAGRLDVRSVQAVVERAIAGSGFRTLHGQYYTFPNTMVVRLSPEAYRVIQPGERYVIDEIQTLLPKRLAEAGSWGKDSERFRVTFCPDPSLEGLAVQVEAADRDVTAGEPAYASDSTLVWGDDDDVTPSEATVVLSQEGRQGAEWPVPLDHKVTIGCLPKDRSSVKADIQVDNPVVSRLHASITVRRSVSGELLIEVCDLGSTNGTSVNGHKLIARVPTPVKVGQSIRLAGASGTTLSLHEGR